MQTRCYACKRILSNTESVRMGIGPICRARRKYELYDQQKLDREAGRCHFGFTCGNPQHVETLLGRLLDQVDLWPKWLVAGSDETGVPVDTAVCRRLNELIVEYGQTIVDALGLHRPAVEVPEVARTGLDEMLKATGHYLNEANKLGPGQYRVPPDIQAQYRRTVLREKGACPHGLDCREPDRAIAAVYSILGILRNEIEPLFRETTYGGLVGASDAAYMACMNALEVLGCEDEASYVYYQDLPKLRKAAQRNARRWERRLGKRGAA